MGRRNLLRLVLAGALLAVGLTGCGSDNEGAAANASATSAQPDAPAFIQAIRDGKRLRIGIATAPPYVTQDSVSGEWQGPYADFARYWAEELGVEPDFVQTTFQTMVAGIQSKAFTVGLDLTATDVRREAIDFSDPLSFDVGVLIVSKDRVAGRTFEEYNAPSNTVCIVDGTSYDQAVAAGKVVIAMSVLRLGSVQECQTAMETGRVDSVLYGWTAGAAYADTREGIGLLFPAEPFVRADVGIGIAKDADELRAHLNETLAQWKADPDGQRASIERWDLERSPTLHAIGTIPSWAQQASLEQYRS